MQLLQPAFLGLALLALIPLILYFFRRKSKTVEVSTLIFFKSLAKEHQESAWLRHVKKMLSLLLTLIVLFAGIFGLSRVVFSPKAEDLRSVVILLDRSASMAAVGADGRTRLEVAKEEIRARLDALPENVEVSLVAYDSRPEILQPKSVVRRELLRKLRDVELRPVEGKLDCALAAAKMTASLNTPSVIWHATDRGSAQEEAAESENSPDEQPVPSSVSAHSSEEEAIAASNSSIEPVPVLPEGVGLDVINVGLKGATNIGITAFEIRKIPLVSNEYEAFIEIACSASTPDPLEVTLETLIAGNLADTPRTIDLEPGKRRALVMPIKGAATGQVLELRLTGAEEDCFALDDSIITRLPENRPVIAVYVSETKESVDPFTQLALTAIDEGGALDAYTMTSESPLPAEADVFIFDHWFPDDWPADKPAIVIDPPGSGGPIRAVALKGGVPRDRMRVTNPEHPVLFRVSSSRVMLTQTAVVDTSGSLEPLWVAGDEPVLAAGETNGQRLVVLGFSPMQSESLPLMASYPLLLENAILWCSEQVVAESQLKSLRTGDLLESDGGRLSWIQMDGGELVESEQDLPSSLVELDRIGLWQTADGRRGSSMLLSNHESDFPDISEIGSGTGSGVELERKSLFRGDITWMFLWVILIVLIVESYLFHRHSVY